MRKTENIFTTPALILVVILFISCASKNDQNKQAAVSQSEIPDSVSNHFISYSSGAITGQTVYVPVYSHIYQQNQKKTFNLTATLSIRNTDLSNDINITRVYYYDSDGNLIHKYLDEPATLSALSSMSFVVEEEDLRGGVGANFLVLWESDQNVVDPIIEAVMISTSQQQGISFVAGGRVVHSLTQQSDNK